MFVDFHVKYLLFCSYFKIHPVGADLLHADRTDRQTYVTKLTDSSRNYSKAPIESIVSQTPFVFQPFDNNGRT